MNKNRFVLPIAALLMVPCFIGCSTGDVYQASFNNDQIICTYGEQVIDISLTGKTKNMLHFKDVLTKDMFKLPDEYKSKEIEGVYPYNKGSSAYILFGGTVALPEGEKSVTVAITVKKEAFKEKALDSTLDVSLFANQIRYAGYKYSAINDENNEFLFRATIEMIGADALVPQRVVSSGGGDDYFIVTSSKGKAKGVIVQVYELHDNTYLISVFVDGNGATIGDDFKLKFNSKSTTLDEYTCTIELSENPSKDYFLFEKEN